MQIIEVVPLGRQRCKVRTDAGFAFALYKGEIRRYQIETGEELPEDRYREILETVLCPRAREKALYLLQSHDRTEGEIRQKLRDALYPAEAADAAVAFLREYGYLDDMEYGRRYIEIYGTCRSRRRIREDLQKKGLAPEQIAGLLQDGGISEQIQIRSFLEKKGCTAEGITPEQKRKLQAALQRRGYSYGEIREVLSEFPDLYEGKPFSGDFCEP